MKRFEDGLDWGAVPHISTINTFTECAFDGDELGSTDGLVEWRLSCWPTLFGQKLQVQMIISHHLSYV